MIPAVCCLCGSYSVAEPVAAKGDAVKCDAVKGDWIEFQDYSGEETGSLSHPRGLAYFCGEHLLSAIKYQDKNFDDALRELKKSFLYSGQVQC